MNSELIQSISQSNPVVKFCELFDGLSPLWNYELHNHPYLELVYMKSGCGQTDLLEDKQVFTSFDTRVYPVGCWHQDKFEASASNIAYCLWLDVPGITLEKPMRIQDRDGKLGYLFHAIYEEQQKQNPCQPLISLLLRTLLIQVLILEQKPPVTAVERVIQYIQSHLGEQITLEKLSGVAFVSKSYLTKQFKQETGQTVIEYVNRARIDKAKMLLITTSKSVEEVAYAVGFESPKYFFRVFKSLTGQTPLAFAKKQAEL